MRDALSEHDAADHTLMPHLFVVRIWIEPTPAEPQRWHGAVEPLPHGNRRYFNTFAELNRFLASQLQLDLPAPPVQTPLPDSAKT